jgi:hypothetical protein
MLRPDEQLAWNGFLSAEPKFAGEEIAGWVPGPDPPDVLCTTVSRRKVGVELTKWVERDQLESGKIREKIEGGYLHVVTSEKEPRPDKIGWVWLYDKHRRLKPKDEAQFRRELYDCIAEQTALADPDWDNPQGAPVTEFEPRYPMLAKYLDSIWILPRHRLEYLQPGGRWILFENPGGAYTHDWMVQAALDRICSKIDDYEERDLHGQHSLDELHLLCHYDDEALLYNSPIRTAGFGYADLAAKVAEALAYDHGVFDKIFLFHPWESKKVMQVYPAGVAVGKKSAGGD